MLNRIPRGRWRAGMPQDVSILITILFTLQMLNRGVDYIGGDRVGVTESLSVAERAMPLQMWGILFLTVSLTIFAGMFLRREMLIIYGSVVAAGLYGGLAWGLFLRMVERGWPWDGWRTPSQFLTAGLFWLLVAYGTRVMAKARHGGNARE